MITFWWLWILFMAVVLLAPVGYGWGYRQWGPPYPRYMQRRRSERAVGTPQDKPFDHHAWGWGGDFLWIMFFVWILWLAGSLWSY